MESRIFLRLATEDDVEFVADIKSNPALWPYEYDLETDREKARKAVVFKLDGNWYKQYIICLDDERKTPVGAFHIYQYDEKRRSWEIGYCIFPEHRRRGYCFEAASFILSIAFDELGAHRVVAMCNADNEASYRVLEKLGMSREGRFRQELPRDDGWDDQYFYAILDTEYKRRCAK